MKENRPSKFMSGLKDLTERMNVSADVSSTPQNVSEKVQHKKETIKNNDENLKVLFSKLDEVYSWKQKSTDSSVKINPKLKMNIDLLRIMPEFDGYTIKDMVNAMCLAYIEEHKKNLNQILSSISNQF